MSVAEPPETGAPSRPWRARLDLGLDRVGAGRRWAVTTALVAAGIGVLLAAPSYQKLDSAPSMRFEVQHSRGSLFDRHVDPLSQEANLTFRVVPRLIGKALHVTAPWELLVVQGLAGLVLLWAFARLVDEATGNRRWAVLLTVATAGTWAGASAWLETRGLFDALAIAFVLLAMRSRHAVVIGACALLASFTDERAIFVVPLVVLWHVVRGEPGGGPAEPAGPEPRRKLFQPASLALAGAVVAHLAIRTWLKHRYGLSEGRNHSPGNPLKQMNNYPNGLWSALEGMWILAFVGLVAFWQRGWRVITLLAVATTGVVLTIGLTVFDITRSVAYVLPLVPLALVGFRDVPFGRGDRLVRTAATLTLVWPVVYAGGAVKVSWFYPLPLQVFRAVFHLGS